MLFRFTLSNSIEGDYPISDPDGWKEIKIKLERDKEYHSLIEMIDVPLIFYGSNGVVDGGFDFIRTVEESQGVDAEIGILIEVSDDGGTTYETFFNGLLLLDTLKEISDAEPYKLECNIIRNDFWSKFVNRKSQDVNLNSSVSLDGDSLTPISTSSINLISQKIREYSYFASNTATTETTLSVNDYLQVDFENIFNDEIKTKFSVPTGINTSKPVWLYELKYDGTYVFNIIIYAWRYLSSGPPNFASVKSGTDLVDFHIQFNEDAIINFSWVDISSNLPNPADRITRFTYSSTQTLIAGTVIRIFGQINNNYIGGGGDYFSYLGVGTDGLTSEASKLQITAGTTYQDTTSDSYILRDAAESILSKIINRNNVLFSNFLGDETPTSCAANFAIMKGMHVRGYSMADKPMTMSFDDWWNGANPIFNLGLGYETIAGTEYIRIEDKAHFYDDTPIMTFSNVEKIMRVYDKDRIFKSIEIGYEKWSAESTSGIDDPQTKHTYNTRFKLIGKDEKVLSKFIAASLAIEQTRRNRVESGKDWRLDEDVIIISTTGDISTLTPETDESFIDIVNLLHSDTRYNIRLTPARNFERWKPYFNGCLQTYVSNSPCEYYTFSSGEGNYDTVTTGLDACDSGRLAENGNLCVTDTYYHTPRMYEFEFYLNWEDYKTLRDNRHQCIEVSRNTEDYKLCHIETLEYDHYNSIAKFTGWIKDGFLTLLLWGDLVEMMGDTTLTFNS